MCDRAAQGPQQPAHFNGQLVKKIAFQAFAPIGLYFGMLSYNGKVSASVAVDSNARGGSNQAKRLAKHWVPAFKELQAAMAKAGRKVIARA